MVDECPHFSGLHKMHTIQVGNVNSSLIRRGGFLAMLVNVKCKKYNIHSIDVLKHNDTFATVRKFIWVALMSIPGFHKLTYFMFSICGCHLADGKRATY